MNKQIFCILQKDFKEYKSTRTNLVFGITLLGLCTMVMGATYLLPSLVDKLITAAADMVSDVNTITDTLTAFFPGNLKANMGILASDIIIFYGVVVILFTHNLISKEIKEGKWISPISVGYKPFNLILSKGLIFGLGAAIPCIGFYNLYFFVGNVYLVPDYKLIDAISNSLIMGFSIFSIVYITIILASIYKQAITSAITMIPLIAVAPDIFTLFSFGKYFPTYMLTHLYQSSSNISNIIIPAIFTLVIAMVLTVVAAKKSSIIEITRQEVLYETAFTK